MTGAPYTGWMNFQRYQSAPPLPSNSHLVGSSCLKGQRLALTVRTKAETVNSCQPFRRLSLESLLNGKESPEWKVSAAALKARPSERLRFLAAPRQPAPGWRPDRPLTPTLGMGTRIPAQASPRICQLAIPKRIRKPSIEDSNYHLKLPSETEPSSRILLLAVPKKEHPDFLPNRALSLHVPKSVLVAVATERLLELSVPKSNKPLFEDFDPYKISTGALSANASPRILELAVPPTRRSRTKSAHV